MPETKSGEIRTDFQSIILNLQQYWASQGAVVLQPYDMEVGAGTFHPATTLRALGPDYHWRAAYVQPSRRPADGRYGEIPIGFSIIISSRSFSNRHRPTRKHFIWAH